MGFCHSTKCTLNYWYFSFVCQIYLFICFCFQNYEKSLKSKKEAHFDWLIWWTNCQLEWRWLPPFSAFECTSNLNKLYDCKPMFPLHRSPTNAAPAKSAAGILYSLKFLHRLTHRRKIKVAHLPIISVAYRSRQSVRARTSSAAHLGPPIVCREKRANALGLAE